MRSAKVAIRNALAADPVINRLVPGAQIFSVERATLPTLPAVELVSIASERTDRPLIRHEFSCEITVSSSSENGADEKLDAIVTAVRGRLHAAEIEADPIVLEGGSVALVELLGVRWSVSRGRGGVRDTRRGDRARGRASRPGWRGGLMGPTKPRKRRLTVLRELRPTRAGKKALKPFQTRFISAVQRPGIRRAVLSLPRGNGKSWLAGYLASEALRPGGALFRAGDENVLLSGSFDQARYVYRFAKGLLGEAKYAYSDNKQRMEIRHKATGTRLTVKSSRARGAFGLVGARIAIADEPGAWDVVGGELMADALDSSLGKPESDLTIIYIGTLAPAMAGWWPELVRGGSHGSTFVQVARGRPEKVGPVVRDSAVQSADGAVSRVTKNPTRRTRRGAEGFTAQSAVSQLQVELSIGGF